MNVNMAEIDFEISRLQKANADLYTQLQQERDAREKLERDIDELQRAGNGMLLHMEAEMQLAWEMEAAALKPAPQAQTEATPDSGGGL